MVYIKLLMAAFFWGGTFIGGKFLSGNMNPMNAAFLRFVMASALLLLITWKKEGKLPAISKSELMSVTLLGATGVFLYNILFFSSFHYITAGKASLIIATNPVMITFFSVLIFKEEIDIIKAMGVILSVIGAMVIISDGNLLSMTTDFISLGEVLVIGCVASWVAYSLIGKMVLVSLSPLVSVCYSAVAGTLLLFIPTLLFGQLSEIRHYGFSQWGTIVYLAFFGTVLGFLWYYDGIKKIGAMKASVFINFVPVSAVSLAWLILAEPVSSAQLIGAALVMTGVYASNRTFKHLKKGWSGS